MQRRRFLTGLTQTLAALGTAPALARAIEMLWRTRKPGYLPRLDNTAAASLLDSSHGMHAEILGIDDPDREWEPLRLRLWVQRWSDA